MTLRSTARRNYFNFFPPRFKQASGTIGGMSDATQDAPDTHGSDAGFATSAEEDSDDDDGDDDGDDDDGDDGGSRGADTPHTMGTWTLRGDTFILSAKGAAYGQRCAPSAVTDGEMLWALPPADGDGLDNLNRLNVLDYNCAVRDCDRAPKLSRPYYVAAGQRSRLAPGNTQVPATEYCKPCIRPHYPCVHVHTWASAQCVSLVHVVMLHRCSSLKQPRIWRSICARLAKEYPSPCPCGGLSAPAGQPCACCCDDVGGSSASDVRATVKGIVRSMLRGARFAVIEDLEKYCLFWCPDHIALYR